MAAMSATPDDTAPDSPTPTTRDAAEVGCPCGGPHFALCCGPIHAGAPAPTAEALMRSRYTAYTLGNGGYVAETQAKTIDAEEAGAFGLSVRWLGLHIFERVAGGPDDATGVVAFVARYAGTAGERALVEVSHFDRVDGRWRYLRGDAPRLGPASRCPCGRGARYGRCCGRR
jgi:SEC-C motif-containing protein